MRVVDRNHSHANRTIHAYLKGNQRAMCQSASRPGISANRTDYGLTFSWCEP